MAAEQAGFSDPVLLPDYYAQTSYIPSSLKMLGKAVQYYNPDRKLTAGELIVPAHVAPTGNYNPQLINLLRSRFSAAHAAKDSTIAWVLGAEAGINMPLAGATKQQFDKMVALGLGGLDKSGVAELTFKGRHA